MTERPPTPPELMRSWHPDLFSDTERKTEPAVPVAVLDHYLETLTNRKQENEFEYFARSLAERELCPNLRPQTGPTGGGDSKVDTETYPVASELAMRWYYGDPEAAGERWAFAFSAKKKWRDKVKADVTNIISTGRPYKRIYFVTNQYAPEKPRADLEDTLTNLTGVPVTILDRTWILEKVYSHRLLELAVRALDMRGYAELIGERAGPRDTERQVELERLDAAVADPTRYGGARYSLAEDALESALLARGLERSRNEVEGRFLAAARIAEGSGHEGQRLRIAYSHAWTAYWWFDDASQFDNSYEAVAALALASDEAADLELLLNLWMLHPAAAARGTLTSAKIEPRGEVLRASLERVAGNSERPNNAAQARTSLLVMSATRLMQQQRPEGLPAVWGELRDVLAGVEQLGDYPVERIHELISRMGEYVPESDAFDGLYEELVTLLERRRSEAEGGLAYLRRGKQKLEKGHRYDAIRMLGKAETRLIKAEYTDELVETLIAIGQAYSQADLKWAARAKLIVAADRLLAPFMRQGRLDARAALPLRFLVQLELELGRVPQVLGANELYRIVVASSEQPEQIAAMVPENLRIQDAVLGMLLMRSDLGQLRTLERAPAMLERQGFQIARGALLWALGGPDAVRRDGFAPAYQDDAAIAELFERLAEQPAAQDIPPRPTLAEGSEIELRTVVLGVEVIARVACERDSIFLAEAILAAFESFLSTSLGTQVFPYRERLEFSVSPGSDGATRPNFQIDDLTNVAAITHGVGNYGGATDYPAFVGWLQEVLIRLALRMLIIDDPEKWMERVAGDEVGFGRALALGAIAVATRNIFGDEPRVLLADWIVAEDERHPLERTAALPPSTGTGPGEDGSERVIRFGTGEAAVKFDPEAGGHADRRVMSPIDIPLWDRAKWRATGFGWGEGEPPILMLAFHDFEAGKAIFRSWYERYGASDKSDALRVSIVRGIARDDPHAYTVMLSSELDGASIPGSMFYLSNRINRMKPTDSKNLDTFLTAYARAGCYLLAPMPFRAADGFQTIDTELAIAKRKLVVRDAWTISENDLEVPCIDPDETPLIPDGVDDAPILRTLERVRRSPQAKTATRF